MQAKRIRTFTGHHGGLYALAPGPGPDTFFTAGADKMIVLWDMHSETSLPFVIRTEHSIYSLALGHDRQHLWAGTSTGNIHVIDLEKKQEIKNLALHKDPVFYLFSDGKNNRIYACSGDGSISVWGQPDFSLIAHVALSEKKVRRAALNADGTLAAFACGDGSIQVFHTETLLQLHTWHAHADGTNSLAFLPNGDLLSGGKDAHLKKWAVREGFQNALDVPAHNYAIYDLQLSADGKILASVSRDKTVKLWDINNLEKPLRLDRKSHGGHLHSVNACLWLDGHHLITCSDDRSAVLWEVQAP